jgi:hypothetical protein
MFKTILVPASGSRTTATAALAVPQFAFCRGAGAISHELERRRTLMDELATSARRHGEDFCKTNRLGFRDMPYATGATVTASWLEELDQPTERFLFHARHTGQGSNDSWNTVDGAFTVSP